MELTQLINSVKTVQVIGEVQRQDVSGIFHDSRKVIKNSIFVAIKGFNTDGHRYILDAINKGAIGVILEDNNVVPDDIFIHGKVAKILVRESRVALAEISGSFYKDPSSKLKTVGITGTKGKTTTSYYLKSIFETSGTKTGLVGTIANYVGDREIKSLMTTPESNDLNEILFEMNNENCGYAVMEVSSHSLVLNRVYGLKFAAGIFTNITSDHMDFHENLENYLKAKKILFDNLAANSFGIYNIDDKNSKVIIQDSKAKLFSFGESEGSDFKIKNVNYDLNGTRFLIEYNENDYAIETSLIGEFNAYNACASFAAAVLLGIKTETAAAGIKNTKQVPGRFEVIGHGKKKVILDYSHTSDSLEKALIALRKISDKSIPIYTVFGCGGNRDKTKRPVMGKIATEMSNHVIVTSDNPRFEDPFDIIEDIKKGIKKDNYMVIENREQAIKQIIEDSPREAVILIAGKGHETYQEVKGVRNHFSDKEIAEKYLN